MTDKQIEEEIKQVRDIPKLKIGKIGFISINGFERTYSDFPCIEGNTLYEN